jgi:outer membrane lipoprotein-sorting protein
MKKLLGLLILSLGFVAAASAAEPKMVKLVLRDVSPGVDPNSFAAKPRTMYRVGDKLGRMEEAPNPATGAHLLFVVNHPDVWFVNLADKTGRHVKDPDPKGVFRAPVIAHPDLPELTKALEIGREAEYMNENKAKKAGQEKVAGKECTRYVLDKGGAEISLWTDAKSGAPVRITVKREGKVLKSLEYDTYQTDLQPAADLFTLPKGITVKEAK